MHCSIGGGWGGGGGGWESTRKSQVAIGFLRDTGSAIEPTLQNKLMIKNKKVIKLFFTLQQLLAF